MRHPHERGGPCAALLCGLLALFSGCGSESRVQTDRGPWSSLGHGVAIDPDTPAGAARRYVLNVAESAAPFAMAQQAPAVIGAVGRRPMALALETATLGLLGAQAVPKIVTRTRRRAEIDVRVGGGSSDPKQYRFVLVARGGRWLVAYDTLTRRALSGLKSRRPLHRFLAAGRRVAGGL